VTPFFLQATGLSQWLLTSNKRHKTPQQYQLTDRFLSIFIIPQKQGIYVNKSPALF